jgi:hypothetical protein
MILVACANRRAFFALSHRWNRAPPMGLAERWRYPRMPLPAVVITPLTPRPAAWQGNGQHRVSPADCFIGSDVIRILTMVCRAFQPECWLPRSDGHRHQFVTRNSGSISALPAECLLIVILKPCPYHRPVRHHRPRSPAISLPQ